MYVMCTPRRWPNGKFMHTFFLMKLGRLQLKIHFFFLICNIRAAQKVIEFKAFSSWGGRNRFFFPTMKFLHMEDFGLFFLLIKVSKISHRFALSWIKITSLRTS